MGLKNQIRESVLVFTRTKHGADKLVKDLQKNRIEAAAIHGNKSQNARQRALNEFRTIYNEERPHRSLELETPAAYYTPSERRYPDRIPDPVYPGHFELRRVTKIGVFSWYRHQIFVSQAFHNETLGLECIADGVWSVFFGEFLLGRFSEENYEFTAGSAR